MPASTLQSRPLNRALDVADIEVRRGESGPHKLTFSASSTKPIKRAFGNEILDHAGIRLDRVRAGAVPLLFNHDWDRPIGMVDAARVQDGRLILDAHFFETANAAEVRTMIEGGLRNISIGYRLHKVEKRDDGTYVVRESELYESSVVTVPADASVGIGRGAGDEESPVEIIHYNGDPHVDEEEKRRLIAEAQTRERERIADIRNRCKIGRLDEVFAQHLIEEGVSGDAIAARILDALVERQQANPTRNQNACSALEHANSIERSMQTYERGDRDESGFPALGYGSGDIRGFNDMRAGIIDAVVNMQCGYVKEPSVAARDFCGKSVLELGRHFMAARSGRSVDALRKHSSYATAEDLFLNRSGGHSTSDFPSLLLAGTSRSLRQLYETAPATFWPFVRRVTLPDLRTVDRVAFSNASGLQKINEGGEYHFGTFTEGKKTYGMAKYGGAYSFTLEAIVNNDLGAFERLPRMINQQVRMLQSKITYDMFLENSGAGPTMPDGQPLFHSSHGNLESTPASFEAALTASRVLLRTKLAPDGQNYMDLEPKILLVHPSRETVAEQTISAGTILKTTDRESPVNQWISRLQLIVDPRVSANALYLLTGPEQVDTVEFAELEGEAGPYLQTREGFEVDEWAIKCRYYCGAAWIDHYGAVKHVLT